MDNQIWIQRNGTGDKLLAMESDSFPDGLHLLFLVSIYKRRVLSNLIHRITQD